MGSGISMSEKELDKQEAFVESRFAVAKNNMSKYKDDGHNRYSDMQIKMKLRQEYHNQPYNHSYYRKHDNSYIPQRDWNTWKNT